MAILTGQSNFAYANLTAASFQNDLIAALNAGRKVIVGTKEATAFTTEEQEQFVFRNLKFNHAYVATLVGTDSVRLWNPQNLPSNSTGESDEFQEPVISISGGDWNLLRIASGVLWELPSP